jgi:glycosyltransferase involved in cell wall biosynthesis
MPKISIIIPARDEIYLSRTIEDLIAKSESDIEIVVVLDGYWQQDLSENQVVKYIHFGESKGMRRAINSAVAVATGAYLLKIDAHCAIQKGYDKKLVRDCKENMVIVPTRYELDTEKWGQKKDRKHEFEYIERGTLKGRKWPEYAERVNGQKLPKLMTMQGSCWFMHRSFYDRIGGIDADNFGSMGREAQEVSIKTWLSGGELVLSRNVWYAHWNKPKEHVIKGVKAEKVKSVDYIIKTWPEEKLKPIIEIFKPVPGWDNE